ncbi:hypothetical protein XGA_3965 [Xanthomonas hortorum ATCC 19865]|nr:hypothetical protein XGA_3965 [Xanthomonas hortorum ATCC 19865]
MSYTRCALGAINVRWHCNAIYPHISITRQP